RAIADAAGDGVVCVAGRFALREFIALVARAPLLISNNTGPAHIAAAVQTPVVVLYALTNPQHAPWRVAHRILPFDVPGEARSRNVLVRYEPERFSHASAGTSTPADIVHATAELLEGGAVSQPELVAFTGARAPDARLGRAAGEA